MWSIESFQRGDNGSTPVSMLLVVQMKANLVAKFARERNLACEVAKMPSIDGQAN